MGSLWICSHRNYQIRICNVFGMGNKPGHEGCLNRLLDRILLGIAIQSRHRFLLERGHDARVVHEAIPLCKAEAQLWPRRLSCLFGLDAKPVDVVLEEGALDVGSDRQHGFQWLFCRPRGGPDQPPAGAKELASEAAHGPLVVVQMALDLAPCSGTCAHHQVEASFEALFVQLPAIEHSWLAVKLVHSKAESLLCRAMPRTLFVFFCHHSRKHQSQREDGWGLPLTSLEGELQVQEHSRWRILVEHHLSWHSM